MGSPMFQVFRVLGLANLVLVALIGLLAMAAWMEGKNLADSGGELWAKLDPASFSQVQRGVQEYVNADLWDSLAVPVLRMPAWQGMGLFAILFLVLSFGFMTAAYKVKKPDRKFARRE